MSLDSCSGSVGRVQGNLLRASGPAFWYTPFLCVCHNLAQEGPCPGCVRVAGELDKEGEESKGVAATSGQRAATGDGGDGRKDCWECADAPALGFDAGGER